MAVERSAEFWIEHLGLVPHPEGGWFRETYRASETIGVSALPPRFAGPRAFSTAIYFLLRSGERSRLHRLRSDELWFFHAGGPLTIAVLDAAGARELVVGVDPEHGERLQAGVPAGSWFGATGPGRGSYALAGCSVAPGFDFADFELADRDVLLAAFPAHAALIRSLT